jgi:DHA1 family bicyclomycin/chloramphenicol resistance-like MFS transporter
VSGSTPLLLLLSTASALSPFGMVVVVPTLSEFARQYGIDYSQSQFLISGYLFGLGAAQPFSGILCDRLGRRPVLLLGFAFFTIASFVCAMVDDLSSLVIMRFLQAVGVSVGTVASRAIVRDTHDELGAARAMSYIAAAMGVAPVVAPVIGGISGDAFGPQSVFLISAVMGSLVWLWILRSLPETGQAARSSLVSWRRWWANYGQLLASRVFMGYTLMYGFVQGSFFAFLAVGPAVFEIYLGLGQREFGLIWGFMAFSYVMGIGVVLTMGAGWALLLLVTGPGISLLPLVVILATLTGASGLVIPVAMAGAVSYRPEIAGTSSGLSSAMGLVLSGAFTIVSGFLFTGSFTPIAALIAAAATLTAATTWMVRR